MQELFSEMFGDPRFCDPRTDIYDPCPLAGAQEYDCTTPGEVRNRSGSYRALDVGLIQTPATPGASRRSAQRSVIRPVRGRVARRATISSDTARPVTRSGTDSFLRG